MTVPENRVPRRNISTYGGGRKGLGEKARG
jgi:hypothetical protein